MARPSHSWEGYCGHSSTLDVFISTQIPPSNDRCNKHRYSKAALHMKKGLSWNQRLNLYAHQTWHRLGYLWVSMCLQNMTPALKQLFPSGKGSGLGGGSIAKIRYALVLMFWIYKMLFVKFIMVLFLSPGPMKSWTV